MFRKLVANLSFSPSLVGELSMYAEQLKHEQRRRAIGLLFLVFTVIAQCVTLALPPESANQASDNDLIYGGVTSLTALLAKYDNNEQNIRDIYTTLGITRTDLQSTTLGTLKSSARAYTTGRTPFASRNEGERAYSYTKANHGTGTVYLRPLSLYDTDTYATQHGTPYTALLGTSAKTGRFAVFTNSGNLTLERLPSLGTESTLPCATYSRESNAAPTCQSPIIYTKTAYNHTRNQPAQQITANASDRITYSLTARNTSETAVRLTLIDQIRDTLEYATLVETEGGTLDAKSGTLVWPAETLEPGTTITRHFSVRIAAYIPATGRGLSNPASYDCQMANTLGTSVQVPVACPAAKSVETLATQLPHTSIPTALAASSSALGLALLLYLRARQQREEVRLIRHDLNTGTFI